MSSRGVPVLTNRSGHKVSLYDRWNILYDRCNIRDQKRKLHAQLHPASSINIEVISLIHSPQKTYQVLFIRTQKGVLRWRSLCKFCRKSLHFILSCTKLGHSSSFSIQNSRLEGFLVRQNLNLPPILRSTTSKELLNGKTLKNREGNQNSLN